jgi:hypothetical protein
MERVVATRLPGGGWWIVGLDSGEVLKEFPFGGIIGSHEAADAFVAGWNAAVDRYQPEGDSPEHIWESEEEAGAMHGMARGMGA